MQQRLNHIIGVDGTVGPGDFREDVSTYIKRISDPLEWISATEMKILADALNIRIVIYYFVPGYRLQ